MRCPSRSARAGCRKHGGGIRPSSAGRRSARSRGRECGGRPPAGASADTPLRCEARRTTVGPTLPSATRPAGRAPPAIITFEMACARRVPTLRHHCLPSTRGISTPRSARRAAARSYDSPCRNRRTAPAAHRSRSQDDHRLGGGKDRQRVAGGRSVGDIAAERAAILDLDVRRPRAPPRPASADAPAHDAARR